MKKSRFFRMITITLLLAAMFGMMGTQASAAELTGRLEGMPEELENHVLVQYRGNGDCKELTGSIAVMLLFVDEPGHAWTKAERDTYTALYKKTQEREIYRKASALNLKTKSLMREYIAISKEYDMPMSADVVKSNTAR